MFEVVETNRKRYRFEVRWNGGKSYCRCIIKQNAEKIAHALNHAPRDLDAPLTDNEIIAVNKATGML